MSYQVLARKWRPKSFNSLKGQWHVVRALMNSIARSQIHHAYLFTGTRGVGKTTLARILAKAFNCETGVTANPCGKCANCLAIDAGRFVDLLEIDAASRTGVEDTRELLENVQYAPTEGRYKIYLIDEVHMLSGHSFNALLKTLEEPPQHVVFVLATTDPERIPVTVLSRCLRFNLRPLPELEIVAQLKEILEEEHISFEQGALDKLARMAQGSMRDALNLLEQAIAYSDNTLELKSVEEMLGIAYERSIPSLVSAILSKNVQEALTITADMAQSGADFDEVCSSLQRAFYALALQKTAEVEKDVLSSLVDIDASILSLQSTITAEELQLLYQIALNGKKDLRYTPDERTGFEMTLLRMIVFRPRSADKDDPRKEEPKKEDPKKNEPKKEEPKKEVPPPTKLAPVNSDVQTLNWVDLISKLSLSGLTAVLVKHCIVSSWDGQRLELILDMVHQACLNETRLSQIQEAVSQHLQRPIKVSIKPGKVGEQTPSMQTKIAAEAKREEALHSIHQDPAVKNILSTFDADIKKVTVVEKEGE